MEVVAGGGGGGGGGAGAVGAAIANVSLICEALLFVTALDTDKASLPLLLLAVRLQLALASALGVSAALVALGVAADGTGFDPAMLLPAAAAAICRANSRSSRSSSRFLRLDAALESAPPCCRCI
jgi:hypothetical protein